MFIVRYKAWQVASFICRTEP